MTSLKVLQIESSLEEISSPRFLESRAFRDYNQLSKPVAYVPSVIEEEFYELIFYAMCLAGKLYNSVCLRI